MEKAVFNPQGTEGILKVPEGDYGSGGTERPKMISNAPLPLQQPDANYVDPTWPSEDGCVRARSGADKDMVTVPLEPSMLGNAAACADAPKSAPSRMANYPMTCNEEGRIHRTTICFWAVPSVGFRGMYWFKNNWMKQFYIDDYPRASLSVMAVCSVLNAMADLVTDPLVAQKSDSFQSKLGRRMPFLLVSGCLALLGTTLSWTPPMALSEDVGVNGTSVPSALWWGLFHMIFKLCETFGMIPYQAQGCEMTHSTLERNRIFYYASVCALIGILMGILVPSFMPHTCTGDMSSGEDLGDSLTTTTALPYVQDSCTLFPILGSMYALMYAIPLFLFPRVMVDPVHAKTASQVGRMGIVPLFVQLSMNRCYLICLGANAIEAIGDSTPFIVMPFVLKYILLPPQSEARRDWAKKIGNPNVVFGLLAVVYFMGQIAAYPCWRWYVNKVGKRKGLIVKSFGRAFVSILWVVPLANTGRVDLAFCISFLWGFSASGDWIVRSVLADIVDYDEFLTGQRREALLFMGFEFVPKFVYMLSEAMPFVTMEWAGFRANKPQNDGVIFALWIYFAILPAVAIFGMAVVLTQFQMKTAEQHARLLDGIETHNQGKPAEDPYFGGMVSPSVDPYDKALTENLQYLFMSEVNSISASGFAATKSRSCGKIAVFTFFALVGAAIFAAGLPFLIDGEDGSVSPIGMGVGALGCLAVVFECKRLQAMKRLEQMHSSGICTDAMLAEYCNYMKRFDPKSKEKIALAKPVIESATI